jgi:hypothetical protein
MKNPNKFVRILEVSKAFPNIQIIFRKVQRRIKKYQNFSEYSKRKQENFSKSSINGNLKKNGKII